MIQQLLSWSWKKAPEATIPSTLTTSWIYGTGLAFVGKRVFYTLGRSHSPAILKLAHYRPQAAHQFLRAWNWDYSEVNEGRSFRHEIPFFKNEEMILKYCLSRYCFCGVPTNWARSVLNTMHFIQTTQWQAALALTLCFSRGETRLDLRLGSTLNSHVPHF